jgi:GntR family transcriptional repressor for pyruvate dehydrogenase complex
MSREALLAKKPKLADIVADHLLEMLRQGTFQAGDKLPAERELASQFGISRASLRDAIRHLELLGYLEVKQGGGTFVRVPDGQALTLPFQALLSGQPHLAEDLIEFRFLLEPEVTALAAMHCTEEDAAALRESLEKQLQLVQAQERLTSEDVRFHHLIARSARNVTVLYILDTLQALLTDLRARLLTGDQPRLTLLQHGNIADAIIRHDAAAAKAHMVAHLEAVMQSVRREEGSSTAS